MELAELGKQPIRPDQPAGVDARYGPAFEKLQAEVDKPLSASGGVDWAKVGKLSTEILAQESKDLLVASYIAVSLLYTKKIDGFAIGLKIYRDILETYWETLFPAKARMRGRIASIEFWVEKSEIALSGIEPRALPPEMMAAIRGDFDKIEELLGAYLEEGVSLRPLIEFVRKLESASRDAVKPAPPPQAAQPAAGGVVPGQTAAAASSPPPSGTLLPNIVSKADVPRVLSVLTQKAREISIFLRKEDLSNPLLYRLGRWALWVNVAALPPLENDRAMVPPPDPGTVGTLESLNTAGNYMQLVLEAEGALGSSIYWLDVNRISAQALGFLGAPFRKAAEAVCQETASFLHRLPGLEAMSFSDGRPFADPETRRWLKEIAPGGGVDAAGTPAGPGDVAVGGGEAGIREEIGNLLAQARQGKTVEAVEAIQKGIHSAASGKERILWRIGLVQALLAGRQSGVALPHVDRLLTDIDAHALEEYDPEVALQILKIAWSATEGREDAESGAKNALIAGRISRIDPVAALRMVKGKK